MGMPNEGAPLPDRSGQRFYPVVSPRGEKPLKVTLLGATFTGVWTHWKDRDFACSCTPDCPHCRAGYGHRWVGFIAAWSWAMRARIVLRLTEHAAKQVNALAEEHGGGRGLSVELRRVYKTKANSKVQVVFVSKDDRPDLMPDFPVLDSVNRLLGLNEAWVAAQERLARLRPGGRDDPMVPLPPGGTTDEQFRQMVMENARLRARLAEQFKMPEGGN